MATFYDALNAANQNALNHLSTLKAADERNPVPSFMNTINARLRLANAINAGKERQDYYNQLKSNVFGSGNQNQQAPQYNQGEGIGFNENGQYKIPAQQTSNPYGVDLSGLGGNEGNTISVSAQNGIQNFQAPKQNAWSNAFGNSESNANPFKGMQSFGEPSTGNPQAQAVEGQQTSPNYMSLMSNGQTNVQMTPQQQQAFDEKMNLRRWIEWDAQNNGVTNPLVALQRYQMFMEPMRHQAEVDELRNAYFTFHDPKASEEDKRNAATLIEYAKGNPFMMEDHDMTMDRYNYNMGMIRNPNFNVGNNILSVLGDYEEGEQWMSPDGTGDSRTQCSNWVSDVLRKAGLKGLGSANGDELMRQFGSAYHTGLDGIQAGDVLNFKDHVGIYAGNGQYVARNSSGGVHQGSMEEAIKYFGQPLGYGSVREFAGANTKYIRDPNQVTPREKFNAEQAYKDKVLNIREQRVNGTSLKGKTGKTKTMSPDDAEQAIYDYADAESPTFQQGHAIGNAWAQDFADYAKEYGDLGQAARQMYYDYAAMSPEERGWSMSSEKLALGVGYAVAHAKGLQGMQASKEAKKVMDYLLNNQTNNQTSTETNTASGEKKKGKISAPKSDKFKNPNATPTRKELVDMGVVDSEGGTTASGTKFNQMMQKKHPILPRPEFSPQHDENLTLRKIFG